MARREARAMPDDVAEALRAGGVRGRYDHRPFYQRDDYVGWIVRAKSVETRRRRIDQMLTELRRGDLYMGMRHVPSPAEAHAGHRVSA